VQLIELSVVDVEAVGPGRAQVHITPAILRAGFNATLTCVAENANPPARVSWWSTSHNGRLDTQLVTVAVHESQTPAENGGNVVMSRVDVALDYDDDLKTVACVANGTRAATSQVQLRVRCKSLIGLHFRHFVFLTDCRSLFLISPSSKQ